MLSIWDGLIIIIDKNINWSKADSEHGNMITAKTNSARSFLQCNLTKCPLSILL